MKIELHRLKIENFKGIKSFETDFRGTNATITAENGVGKTTVYDSVLWLWFGKDSTGRAEFDSRPLNRANIPIKGLVMKVEADLVIDGQPHRFAKEEHEHYVKDQVRGYTAKYWIDGVTKKLKDYQEVIKGFISEERFKLLTDLAYFNEKYHWTNRRKTLIDIGGEIQRPVGFDDVAGFLNGLEIDDFKVMVKEQKAAYAKESDEGNTRIDEIHKNLAIPSDELVAGQKKIRDLVTGTITDLEKKRTDLLESTKARQDKIDQVNHLTCERNHRENVLKSDTSAMKDLQDEKVKLLNHYNDKVLAHAKLTEERTAKESVLETEKNARASSLSTLESIRQEHTKAEQESTPDICFACQQKLPADKVAENLNKHQTRLAAITERADKLKDDIHDRDLKIQGINKDTVELSGRVDDALTEVVLAEQTMKTRSAKIDEELETCPRPKPEDDADWQELTAKIEKAQAEIGEPVSDQLEHIEAQLKAAKNKKDELTEALAQADRAEADMKRIAELEEKEKELAQKIADIDGKLDRIGSYEMAESRLIASAVNNKFKYVQFKLFKQNLNGSIEPCCETLYHGTPYSSLSTGEKIICGVDIVNVLGKHFGASVPMFVDHAESLTFPLEADSQTIELYAVDGVEQLQVEVQEEVKAVA